jgi:hypothetical protein
MHNETNSKSLHWDPQVSDREIYFLGTIFVHWGSMEHEVFMQTLATYEAEVSDYSQLPKAMNNMQFTEVLALWRERVVGRAKGRRAKVLQRHYDLISHLKGCRDALTHGMWHWSAEDLGRISTLRVRKREVITTHFSVEELRHIAEQVAAVNFSIRFPGGLVDLTRARMQQGGYISRRAMAMFAGAPVDRDGFPTQHPPGTNTEPKR